MEIEQMLKDRFGLQHTTLQCDHATQTGLVSLRSWQRSDGKTAIVTGASSGIGAATARALAGAGARVAGGARRVEPLETDVRLELDVTDPASCRRFVDEAVGELGGVDILVNNAGLALGRDPVWDVDGGRRAHGDRDQRPGPDADDPALRAAPHRLGRGSIVNLGSVAGSGRTRTVRRMSRPSSRCTATRVRCATTCRASRSASRTSRPASSRRTSRRSGSAATRRRRGAVYSTVAIGGPLHAEDVAESILFAVTRRPAVNIDEIVLMALAQTSGGNIRRDE